MTMQNILNKSKEINKMTNTDLVCKMKDYEEIIWINPNQKDEVSTEFNIEHIRDAEERLKRFMPFIAQAFPETKAKGGLIESQLVEISKMKISMKNTLGEFPGRLFLKMDSHLPVSGSIKARGGIYEVLKFAEDIALTSGMLKLEDDYSILLEDRFSRLFSQYSVEVGSTGNLGLSIGIISARLGFKVTVHMSSDAKQWKKDLLRAKGVKVVEYPDDYQVAVKEGREAAQSKSNCHFVDDEGSKDLFLGYSVAGPRILNQLRENNILVDDEHPLFVYIPCGVGGAPGGVAFGLKQMLGKNVHIFFAEPTHAPAMTLGLITGLMDKISCKDIGMDGVTEADGLAVCRPSRLVSLIMDSMLDSCFTVSDKKLYVILSLLCDSEDIFVEPSSCPAFIGPSICYRNSNYKDMHRITETMFQNSTHIIWATGGNMVPEKEREIYYEKGRK